MLTSLDEWLAAGKLSAAQHDALSALVSKRRVSLFVELNALLYLGVLAFAGGLAWTASTYANAWGDLAILLPATAVFAGCFYYCFTHGQPYSRNHVPAPGLVFDYVLYLGCLIFAVELGYVEYRFHLLQARWDYYLLASAAGYVVLAYRFDNRFVLSLGIATLGSWFGVRLSALGFFVSGVLHIPAVAYGLLVGGLGVGLHRLGLKRHFLDTYLHVAVNVVLGALAFGALAGRVASPWLLGLLLCAAASIAGGVRYRRFAFVVYGTVYGYFGISRVLVTVIHDATGVLSYFVVSALLVILGLIALSSMMGRAE